MLVGGLLTSGPGWQLVFLVNVPVGLLAAALVPFVVPAGGPGSSSRRLGIPGAALATIASGAMVFGLIAAQLRATTAHSEPPSD